MTHKIDAAIQNFHLLQHPFYQAWMSGELSKAELQDYAGQYYFHVNRFPRYLSSIHSLSEDEAARKLLLENLNDEEGTAYGVSHPELWIQFAEGLGLTRSDTTQTLPREAIQAVAEIFFRYARSSFHEGLGALYAYESQVPEIATSKIEGLKARYGVTDPRALQFFEVHQTADVGHRESIRALLDSLPAQQQEEAQIAAEAAAKSLWNFLSDVRACA